MYNSAMKKVKRKHLIQGLLSQHKEPHGKRFLQHRHQLEEICLILIQLLIGQEQVTMQMDHIQHLSISIQCRQLTIISTRQLVQIIIELLVLKQNQTQVMMIYNSQLLSPSIMIAKNTLAADSQLMLTSIKTVLISWL